MLNYQSMKHTNQLISYYTKEIILCNTHVYLEQAVYKHNLSTACKKTWYNLFVGCLQL